MSLQFKKATRSKVKIRMNISAPTGFGKTYSALLLAYGMTGDWSKVAVIDSENESASLYSHLGDYNTVNLAPPFMPAQYIEAIKLCEANGMEAIIIDSITHLWKGEGGLLEHQNNLGGRYQDWAKTTPLYQKFLTAMLHSPAHIITTTRKKQAYNMTVENNRAKVEKAGLEDEIRDGYTYEMTLAFDLINDKNLAKADKDRTGLFAGQPEFVITPETGKKIKEWCEKGVDAPKPVLPILDMNNKLWNDVLAAYKNGTRTMEQLRDKFTISTEIEQEIINLSSIPA